MRMTIARRGRGSLVASLWSAFSPPSSVLRPRALAVHAGKPFPAILPGVEIPRFEAAFQLPQQLRGFCPDWGDGKKLLFTPNGVIDRNCRSTRWAKHAMTRMRIIVYSAAGFVTVPYLIGIVIDLLDMWKTPGFVFNPMDYRLANVSLLTSTVLLIFVPVLSIKKGHISVAGAAILLVSSITAGSVLYTFFRINPFIEQVYRPDWPTVQNLEKSFGASLVAICVWAVMWFIRELWNAKGWRSLAMLGLVVLQVGGIFMFFRLIEVARSVQQMERGDLQAQPAIGPFSPDDGRKGHR